MAGPIARSIMLLGVLVALASSAQSEDATAHDKQALAPLQPYVGVWRGVGLPKRGISTGAWTEASEWAWRFEKDRAELLAKIQDGKFYQQLVVRPGDEPGQFVLLASVAPADDQELPAPADRFAGELADGVLRVTAASAEEGRPARISVRLVAGGDRMLVLYEKRLGGDAYARLAEVGSTRKGSSFATKAAPGRECIVTGGLGTIAVSHQGKTYYVCCTGCRDLFNEDPAGVLEEFRQRKAAEEKEQEGEQ